MDPILIKAIRALVSAQRNAAKAGVALAPEDQDAFMREETRGKFGLKDAQEYLATIDSDIGMRNLGRSFAQGVTMKFGDELAGLVGGEGAKEEMRLRDEMFNAEHPLAAGAAEIGGGIASGIATGPLAPSLQVGGRVASAAVKGATLGAAYGGAAGAGGGEGLAGRARGAAAGAVGGGVVGGTLGAGAAKVSSVLSTRNRAISRVADAVKQSGGMKAVQDNLRRANSAGRGKVVVAGDLSPHLQKATDFAVNNNPNTYVEAAGILNPRQANMTGRLLNDTRRAVGDRNAPQRADELSAATRSWAASDEGYSGLRGAEKFVDPAAVTRHLSKPTIAKAWNYARLAGDIKEGDPLDNVWKSILDPEARPISFGDMQAFKRVLDAKVKSAYAKGDGELGEAYKLVRDNVRETMIDVWPGYANVDKAYAARKRLERVLDQGVEAMKNEDSRQLADDVAAMTPDELDEFRTGMASKLIVDLRSAQTNRNVAARIVEAGDAVQDKLKIIFGDLPTFNRFMEGAKWEMTMASTKNTLGGSATHRRGADSFFDPASSAPPSVQTNPLGLVAGTVDKLIGNSVRAATSRTASKAGRMLLTQGSPNIEKMFRGLLNPEPLLNAGLQGALSGGGGLLSSR